MLSFLAPAFLIGAAAAAIPVFLHLFKRQTEQQVAFSAVRFLRRAPVEQARRRKLRELLLLALRVSAVILLAFAFARPYFAAATGTSGRITVVAVDRSFSMSPPARFARAQELARSAVRSAPSGDRVALIVFADEAEVIVPPTTDRAEILGAIDRLETGYGATRYGVALGRSGEVLASAPGRVVLVTDLQESGWAHGDRGGIPGQVPVDVVDVAEAPANLAVVEARPDPDGMTALVRNFGAAARSGKAHLTIDGRAVADTQFQVEGGIAAAIHFQTMLPSRGVAAVAIDDAQGFEADNTRYVLLDPAEPSDLLLVTGSGSPDNETFYLDRALLIGGESSRFRSRHVSAAKLSDVTGAELSRYSLVLLLGTRGLDRKSVDLLSSYVSAGGGLFLAAGPDIDMESIRDLLSGRVRIGPPAPPAAQPLSLAPVDARHPVFKAFGAAATNLSSVRFRRAVRVTDEAGGRVIGRFSDGSAALVDCVVGKGRLVFFASDLNNRWNDFPLHPVFVPFVHELARYLSEARDRRREVLVAELPPNTPKLPGVHTIPEASVAPVSGAAQTGRRVVANVDPQESDPTRLTSERFAAAMTRLNATAAVEAQASARTQEEGQRLWRYGLLLMVVGLVIEGFLGGRMG